MGERGAESERGGLNCAVSCLASLRCTGKLPSFGPESGSEVAVRRSLTHCLTRSTRALKMPPISIFTGDLASDFAGDFVGDFVGDRSSG